MTSAIDLTLLPQLPRDADGPVFSAPWQAQAFAMTVKLHERGVFGWTEWADALGAEIARARDAGGPSDGSDYYERWLAALERLVIDKGVATRHGLGELADAWQSAAAVTPHGEPIVLKVR